MTREQTPLRKPWNRSKKLFGLSLLLLASCSGKDIAGIRSACAVFPAPSWSSRDTAETQIWFEGVGDAPGYAARWHRLCAED